MCLVLLALGVTASAENGKPLPGRTLTERRPIQGKAVPAVQISPTVKASIERPDAELRTAAMRGLNSKDRGRLQRVVHQLRAGNHAAGQREWESFIRQRNTGSVPMDINALIQYVLRQSYLETNKDLQFYANKVRYFNELKKSIRAHLTDIREQYAEWTRGARKNGKDPDSTRPNTVLEPVLLTAGKLPLKLTYRRKTLRGSSEWEAYIEELEQQLSSAGDDAQLANLDLQSLLQKQQQTLQLMSQVSKQLHDTAMAIVRKLSG
jgi:hypothetical protein